MCSRKMMAYTSKSLYMMVKKTWRKRLTALSNTARRKSHASPVILAYVAVRCRFLVLLGIALGG